MLGAISELSGGFPVADSDDQGDAWVFPGGNYELHVFQLNISELVHRGTQRGRVKRVAKDL